MSIMLSVLYQESYWFHFKYYSVPSEGSVWIITFVLKTTTSYLHSACSGGGRWLLLVNGLSRGIQGAGGWEGLETYGLCIVSVSQYSAQSHVFALTEAVKSVSQTRYPSGDSQVLTRAWALKYFAYRNRCCQN